MSRYKFLLVLNFVLILCSPAIAENALHISGEQSTNLGVKLGKMEVVAQFPVLSAPAKVVIPPTQDYVVSATQAGFIEKLNAAVGDNIVKGQVLAQLNSPELLMLQQEYLKADNALQLVSAIYQRDKKLLQEGVIADRRWQDTSSQYHSAISETDKLRQLLEMTGMTTSEVGQFGKTHRLTRQLNVKAPITGVVIERLAIVGTHIDMMAPLYRVANLDQLWLEIAIPQERIASLKIGDRVEVENSKMSAKISLLGQSVNPENQTILARAVVDKQNPASLRAGQRLNIKIIQLSDKTMFKVPNAAIAQNEGKAFIFIRQPQGFMVTPITVIGKQEADSIISGDFTGNEDIAINGAVALKANWLGLGREE
jgi:cobalt-zinc-cadmium efflux system membrane fusion protein